MFKYLFFKSAGRLLSRRDDSDTELHPNYLQLWQICFGLLNAGDTDILEWVQQRVNKMVRGLEHRIFKKKQRIGFIQP